MFVHRWFTILYLLHHLDLAHLQENVALGKPTFQPSTYDIGFSTQAVDGNRASRSADGSCTHTMVEDHPWWTVDLQSRHLVDSVNIINRGDCCGERLSMIRIGTTDVSPDVVASTVNNIKLCASQDTPVGHGVTQAFRCGTTGRYLVVLLDQRGVLTLCGVEVFSGGIEQSSTPTMPLAFRPSTKSQLSKCLLGNLTPEQQRDMFRCLTQCLHSPSCKAVNLTSCEQSYVRTDENMDFVKQVLN